MKTLFALALVAASLSWSSSGAAAEHRNVYPQGIHADKTRPCVFFYLKDVTQPDPAVPGASVFAIARTHPAFAELFAMVMTSRATNVPMNVFTTGAEVCGQAEVQLISF
jgi:hypothetical protein